MFFTSFSIFNNQPSNPKILVSSVRDLAKERISVVLLKIFSLQICVPFSNSVISVPKKYRRNKDLCPSKWNTKLNHDIHTADQTNGYAQDFGTTSNETIKVIGMIKKY